MCCRLVPPGPPNSVPVRCPMRLRHPILWGGFLPECRHRHPVALPLHPSPPSGWVWDLMSFKIKGKLNAPLRIRAVPGTQHAHYAPSLPSPSRVRVGMSSTDSKGGMGVSFKFHHPKDARACSRPQSEQVSVDRHKECLSLWRHCSWLIFDSCQKIV